MLITKLSILHLQLLLISKNDAKINKVYVYSVRKNMSNAILTQEQAFGSDQSFENIEQDDIINSIKFDPTGEFLAIGDNAGRVIIFKQQYDQFDNKKTFNYYSQFQSHVPEFDSLNSMTISESILHMNWLRPQGKYHKLITANINSIKLWKFFEKVDTKVILTAARQTNHSQRYDLAIPLLNRSTSFTSNLQITFPIKYQSIINQVEVSKNEQYIFSTDQQRGMMWNFDKYNAPFIVQDIKQKKNWKDCEKITCSKIHPTSDNIFTVGTTKGRIQLNDLRLRLNNRKNTEYFNEKQTEQTTNSFKQITSNIHSLQFLANGRYIVSRDYLTVKLWDISHNLEPVSVLQISPSINQKMCNLFENGCIEDQFQLSSFSENFILTGNYDNKFHLINPLTSTNIEYSMDFNPLKATKSLITGSKKCIGSNFNTNKKVQACGVHSPSQRIALSSLNSFFLYSQQKQPQQKIEIQK